MIRLLTHILSNSSIFALIILIYVIALFVVRKKLTKNKLAYKIGFFIPLMISIMQFLIFNLHQQLNLQINLYWPVYFLSIVLPMGLCVSNNKIMNKFFSIFSLLFAFISFFYVEYKTIMIENIHNLTYLNYTESFNQTIKILKKEYILNDHKKINYDYLNNKYFSNIQLADKNHDEQLYLKTMYEFTNEFHDNHLTLDYSFQNMDELEKKTAFFNDYINRDYGFGSILLSDGNYVAILVEEGSQAYQLGLRDGMIITKKDNIPLDNIVEKVIIPFNNSSANKEYRTICQSALLFATGNEDISLSFINDSDIEQTIMVKSIGNYNDRYDKILEKLFAVSNMNDNLYTTMLNDNTGYLVINNELYSPIKGAIGYLLDDSSYLTQVIDGKIESLISQGMNKLIIDLRNNSGGYITESEAVASLFTDDKYLVSKYKKYNGHFYDYSYLKGNGKYKNLNVVVLVGPYTVSAADALTYMLSKDSNIIIAGITSSSNSCQSVGGSIFLSNGTGTIYYPIYGTYNEDGTVFIDPDNSENETIKLDDKLSITKDNILKIIYDDNDYLLNYYLNQ